MGAATDSDYILDNAPTEGLMEIPGNAQMALENALQRYLAIHCCTQGVIERKQVFKDRTDHIDLYTPERNGSLLLDSQKHIEFMHRITGYARSLCAAWLYYEQLNNIANGDIGKENPWAAVEGAYNAAISITHDEINA